MNVSPGRRFMIDLLVGSLMADGGLESALNAAITAEIQVWFISFAVQVLLQGTGGWICYLYKYKSECAFSCELCSSYWHVSTLVLWSSPTLFYLHDLHPSLCLSFYNCCNCTIILKAIIIVF